MAKTVFSTACVFVSYERNYKLHENTSHLFTCIRYISVFCVFIDHKNVSQ